jgi:O-antigen ligase
VGTVSGFFWALAIYGLAVLGASRAGILHWRSQDEKRTYAALILLLAGVHATAVRTGAQDVAAHPIVLETAIRGLVDTMAVVLTVPIVVRSLLSGRLRIGIGGSALVVYVFVAAVSTLYSADSFVTAAKVYEMGVALCVVLAAMVVAGSTPVEALSRFLMVIMLLESVAIVIAVVGFFLIPGLFAQVQSRPGFIVEATMVSPWDGNNGLSSSGAIVAVYSAAVALKAGSSTERRLWTVVSILGTIAVVLSSGRQGVAIWLASMAVVLWFQRRRLFLLGIGPAALALIITYWSEISRAILRNQSVHLFTSLSGRVGYWQAAVASWSEHPWLGYGFGVGGRFVALLSIGNDQVSSLHSGYMEALVGVGLLGIVPLLIAALSAIVWCIKSLTRSTHVAEAALLLPILLRTGVSIGFGAWMNSVWLVFASLAILGGQRDSSGWGYRNAGDPALHRAIR